MIDAIVFLGIQGSGKGTQAKLLAAETGYQHINIGDLLRKQSKMDTAVGREIQQTIQGGEMVSDELVFELIKKAVKADCPGLIFDGFPRNLNQAKHLVQNYRLARVYYLDLKESVAVERIQGRRICSQCGANYHLKNKAPQKDGICDICSGVLITRADDSPKAIAKRVSAFFRETYILKDYFSELGVLVSLSAERSISEIQQQIFADIHLD